MAKPKKSSEFTFHDESAARYGAWAEASRDLLEGLVALRAIGGDGQRIVNEVLDVADLKTMRLSWALWAAMCEGDGLDPEVLLLNHMDWALLATARRALWDTPEPWLPPLRVVK